MMYVPGHFNEQNPEALCNAIRAAHFGVLVTAVDQTPFASHLPMHIEPEHGAHGTLYAHVARANDHWQYFAGARESLAIFTGPNAYISPNWLGGQNTVPTWNYVAVHAYGRPRIIEDPDQVLDVLAHLSRDNETAKTGLWTADKMDPAVLRGMLKGIVAFAMPIERIEGKRKMSQNKPLEMQQSAVNGLRHMHDPGSDAVADIMAGGQVKPD